MNLDQEISTTIARLSAGEHPHHVLRDFATTIQSAKGSVVTEATVYSCSSCGAPGVQCVRCAAATFAQDRLLAPLVQRLMQSSQEPPAPPPPAPGAPPPPAGRQTF